MSIFGDLRENALDKLFPRRCPLCGAILMPNERVCGGCSDELEFINPPVCKKCGRPIFDCACDDEASYYDRCVSPFVYTKSIRRGMHRFKFSNAPVAADFFAKFMAVAVSREYSREHVDIITCVPMHPSDLRKRGYNQAALLARSVADHLDLPVYTNVIAKISQNSVQHSLTRAERRKNVGGVYHVVRPNQIAGRTVLICDDIITTGSTLSECARVLKEAGARRVLCVTAAAVVSSAEQNLKKVYVR